MLVVLFDPRYPPFTHAITRKKYGSSKAWLTYSLLLNGPGGPNADTIQLLEIPARQWLLYPRGGVTATARAVHFFAPQTEQRMRRATSSSLASQPQSFAKRCGVQRRSRRQEPLVSTRVYCPNSSLSFVTTRSRIPGTVQNYRAGLQSAISARKGQ
jgi:hypothetical protein